MKLTFNLCFPSYAALTRARMIGFGAFTWVLIKIPVPAKAIIVNREISGYMCCSPIRPSAESLYRIMETICNVNKRVK